MIHWVGRMIRLCGMTHLHDMSHLCDMTHLSVSFEPTLVHVFVFPVFHSPRRSGCILTTTTGFLTGVCTTIRFARLICTNY